MAKVLKGTPAAEVAMPDGVIGVKVNADTGFRDDGGPDRILLLRISAARTRGKPHAGGHSR